MWQFGKKHVYLLIVLFACLFTLIPLLQPGFYPMHDDEQIARLYELHQTLSAGHIPPRISQNLGFGYGYPFFNFYPSFVYYIAEIFVLLGFSFIASTKIMIALGFLLAAISMYVFAKEYLGKEGAALAAVVYTYAPYHALDVYVRGAFPEFWSFVFLPAIFYAYKKLAQTNDKKYILLALVYNACLILTHNLVALMSSIFLGVFLFFLFLQIKKKKSFVFFVFLSGLLSLGLPAYFWIPSFFEKQYTLVDILTKELAFYGQHFVYLRQFFDSAWGYGGSIYGLYDGISFEIGKTQWFLITLSIVFFVIMLIRKKNARKFSFFFLFLGLFGLSLFMASFYSQFVWDHIQPFWYIQFPWRFLLFSAFTAAILSASFLLFITEKRLKSFLTMGAIVLCILLNKHYFQPERYLTQVSDKDYTRLEKIRWDTSKLAFEYVPKGIATIKSDIGTTQVAITKKEIAQSGYTIIKGEMKVQQLEDFPHKKLFLVQVSVPGALQINTYSFPGWEVTVDGKQTKYSDTNKFKLIQVSLTPGIQRVGLVLKDTPLRFFSNMLTVLTLVIVGGYIFYSHFASKKARKN